MDGVLIAVVITYFWKGRLVLSHIPTLCWKTSALLLVTIKNLRTLSKVSKYRRTFQSKVIGWNCIVGICSLASECVSHTLLTKVLLFCKAVTNITSKTSSTFVFIIYQVNFLRKASFPNFEMQLLWPYLEER